MHDAADMFIVLFVSIIILLLLCFVCPELMLAIVMPIAKILEFVVNIFN